MVLIDRLQLLEKFFYTGVLLDQTLQLLLQFAVACCHGFNRIFIGDRILDDGVVLLGLHKHEFRAVRTDSVSSTESLVDEGITLEIWSLNAKSLSSMEFTLSLMISIFSCWMSSISWRSLFKTFKVSSMGQYTTLQSWEAARRSIFTFKSFRIFDVPLQVGFHLVIVVGESPQNLLEQGPDHVNVALDPFLLLEGVLEILGLAPDQHQKFTEGGFCLILVGQFFGEALSLHQIQLEG